MALGHEMFVVKKLEAVCEAVVECVARQRGACARRGSGVADCVGLVSHSRKAVYFKCDTRALASVSAPKRRRNHHTHLVHPYHHDPPPTSHRGECLSTTMLPCVLCFVWVLVLLQVPRRQGGPHEVRA